MEELDLTKILKHCPKGQKLIDKIFNHYKIDYYTFTNILGTYMIAKIRKDKLYENKSRN